ncbi:hypothetical protein A4A49_10180 [Nicotiana attenuata]|uniref:Uncharacterized protein n=1 Tax=Nicotiana attenuata TaxID=49451 RepID=A0A1J6HTY7_NICAT|nr:hypothetical protein A4A49_10180 [Nicotiana attenuata]
MTIPATTAITPSVSLVTPSITSPALEKTLTFVSFLPIQFQTINEDPDEDGANGQQNLAVKRAARRTGEEVPRRIQFSDLAKTTAQAPSMAKVPAPMEQEPMEQELVEKSNRSEEKPYRRNGSVQMGKALTYIPPDLQGDTIEVTIEEEDIKEQQNYWTTALIGYVLDISHPLPNDILLRTPVGVIHQSIEYHWKPKFCMDCAKVGHTTEECRQNKEKGESREFVEQNKRRRNGKRRRKVETKWVAKEVPEPKIGKDETAKVTGIHDNIAEEQREARQLDSNEFPPLSVIRSERNHDKQTLVSTGDEPSCSTSQINTTNRFDVLNQGGTANDTGQGGQNHPAPK